MLFRSIPLILEFYGATEGNVNIFNFEGKPGSVGRVPWFVAHRFPISVVRFDVNTSSRCAPPMASASSAIPTSPAR